MSCILCGDEGKMEIHYYQGAEVNSTWHCPKCKVYIDQDDGHPFCKDKEILKKWKKRAAADWEESIKRIARMK